MSAASQIKNLQKSILKQTNALNLLNDDIATVDVELAQVDRALSGTNSQIAAEERRLHTDQALMGNYSAMTDDTKYLKDKISKLSLILSTIAVERKNSKTYTKKKQMPNQSQKQIQKQISETTTQLQYFIFMRDRVTPIDSLKNELVRLAKLKTYCIHKKHFILGEIALREETCRTISQNIKRLQTQPATTEQPNKSTNLGNKKASRKLVNTKQPKRGTGSGRFPAAEDHWIKVDMAKLKIPPWIKKDRV